MGTADLTPAHAAWIDLPSEEVFPGITRQVFHGSRQTLVRYFYAPGSVFPVHAHPEEQITVVISGTILFEIAGNPQEMRGGDVAVIPGHVPHGARVVGAEAVETFNAMSPRRDASPFARIDEDDSR